ncbi:unnamed protein product [Nippostrongylus brasiliensis]|uniref:PLCXc domain-containing protein n=1 Tax=Nippostrongylus brasiliensis TaxID=27835 RepID=A0A0N4YPB8_NIPBR|nr:unnamed protein product [Nippostrongylus brasiliensis]
MGEGVTRGDVLATVRRWVWEYWNPIMVVAVVTLSICYEPIVSYACITRHFITGRDRSETLIAPEGLTISMAEQQSSRTQVSAPTSSKVEPEYSPKSLEKWMSELPSYLSALPLCQLKIPGSHDSGSTDDLDKSLPVANDQSSLIRNLGITSWVKSGIKRWAVTQRHGIGDQLRAGVRYLDLRISYPPPKVRTSNTDFRVVHALYGISVQKLLAEVIDFLKENPKELRRWFSSLRKSYSTRANKAVLGWLNDLSEENKEKVNIVLLDFVCAESSEDILSLNAVMGPKAAKGSAETKSAIVESSTNLADPVLA